MRTRVLLALFVISFTLCVVACGGAGDLPRGGTGKTADVVVSDRGQGGAKPPADLPEKRWADRVKTARAARVAAAEARLEAAEENAESLAKQLSDAKGRLKRSTDPAQIKKLRAEIESLTPKVDQAAKASGPLKEELRRAQAWEPRTMPDDLETGDLTRLGNESGTPIFKVFQIQDANNMLVEYNDRFYWVEGVGTRKLADGDRVTLPGIIECPGSRQYTTAIGGTKTVRVIRVLTTE